MRKQEAFLNLYREYETLIRSEGLDPKEYEEKSENGERLRILRQFRNYMSHQNDPGFLEVSDKQISFLAATVKELKEQKDILKKHLKTPSAGMIAGSEKCFEALQKCAKLKIPSIAVVTKTGCGVADIYSLVNAYAKSKTAKVETVKLAKPAAFLSPDVMMDEVPEGVVICTSDGTPNGKLIGVLYG